MISKCPPTLRTRIGSITPFSRIDAVSSVRSPRLWRGCFGFGLMSSMGMSRPMASPLGRASWSTKWVSCRMRIASGRPSRRTLDTFDDLLAEAVVLVGAARLGSEGEDRLLVRRALFQPDALRDRRLEHAAAEHLGHGFVHVAGERRPLVVESDHCAQQLQVGVGTRADLVHGLEQV